MIYKHFNAKRNKKYGKKEKCEFLDDSEKGVFIVCFYD